MLKYYKDENKRHRRASAKRLSRKRMVSATKVLFYHFDLPAIEIKHMAWGSGEYNSAYFITDDDGEAEAISYGDGMRTLLTVAHEVAHYYRWVEQKKRKNKSKTFRWHDYLHAMAVDEAVEVLTKKGY